MNVMIQNLYSLRQTWVWTSTLWYDIVVCHPSHPMHQTMAAAMGKNISARLGLQVAPAPLPLPLTLPLPLPLPLTLLLLLLLQQLLLL